MNKRVCATLTAGFVAGFITSPVQAEIGGNITVASDYIFRGVSRTEGGPAIQGGFDYEHDSGFYVGAWASNVFFAESIEIDYYGGYTGDLTDIVSFDVGYIYYDFPGAGDQDLDFQEIYGSLSFAGFTAGLAYTDEFRSTESAYFSLSYDLELASNLGLSIFGGLSIYEDDFWGDEDEYMDYGVALNYTNSGLDFGLSLTDTDLDDSDCSFFNNCDAALVFSISKSL